MSDLDDDFGKNRIKNNDIKLQIENINENEMNESNNHPENIKQGNIAVYDNPAFSHSLPQDKDSEPSYEAGPSKEMDDGNDDEDDDDDDDDDIDDKEIGKDSPFSNIVFKIKSFTESIWTKNSSIFKKIFCFPLVVGFYVYLGLSMYYGYHKSQSWCDGSKFFLILIIFVHIGLIYKLIIKKMLVNLNNNKSFQEWQKTMNKIWSTKYVQGGVVMAVICAIIIFIIIDAFHDPRRLISASGIFILIFIGFIFSTHPHKIRWRPVFWGILLQFVFGLIILRWSFGKNLFECISEKIKNFMQFTDTGSAFVFGYLVTGNFSDSHDIVVSKQNPVFAFKVLTVVIFFNACTAILYHLGVMQVIVEKIGWLLQVSIGTTVAESINAAGNIFLGMTEAPLIIAPFLPNMTPSELHSVLTGGFATIAGGVMAAYINFGIDASHLLSASVMSAPAALGISKLLLPETKISKTDIKNIKMVKSKDRNIIDAASRGASQSILMIANIVVVLVAFMAIIAMLDFILSYFASLVGYPEFNFEYVLSKLFVPLSLIMGVELKDAEHVAKLIGLKTVVNEFVAYGKLGKMIEDGLLSPRSQAIATYALCGFSNFGSIGIQLGVLGAIAPNKKSVLAKIAVRAMVSGSIACFLTACVAGTLIPSFDLPTVNNIITQNVTEALNTTIAQL